MELIWLVLALLIVDLAAILFAADTRPGFGGSPRPWAWPGAHAEPPAAARPAPLAGARPGARPGSPWTRRSFGG